ncbi:MAG TPA: TldD/PmbA family protein [Candidatus Marinimicrobia bacterium]|nr:TldD/PmbA family protein [Candidatus Neomarinimicrobiota bacterium]
MTNDKAKFREATALVFDRFGVDDAMLKKILQAAMSKGGDFADIYFEFSRSNNISIEDSLVSRASSNVTLGMGVRVLKGDQTGYSFTEELTPETMLRVANTAANIAIGSSKNISVGFEIQKNSDFYPIETRWEDAGIDQRISLIKKVDTMIYSLDSRVSKANVNISDDERYLLYANSEGIIAEDYQPMTRLGASVVAVQNGRRENNFHNYSLRSDIRFYTEEKLETLAKETVRRTTALFDAVNAPAGEMPVVLAAGSSGILLHEAIGHGMEADFNRKGISIYSDKIGKMIAEPFVTIVDNAMNKNIRGSINVDDEGVPGQRTVLVDNGKMVSYIHDRISAKHYGVKPTGNGRRESFRHKPLPRMRNTYMENGPHTPEEIIASVKKGIYADQFTNGEVNIGAGDFTFYVKSGYLIEDGKLTKPVKDVNIIGNGPDVLTKIVMVADDLKLSEGGWTCGKDGQGVPVSQGIPTCKISSVTVGGMNS